MTWKLTVKGGHVFKQAIRILVLGSAFASGVAAALPIDQQQPNFSTVTTGVNNLSAKIQGFTPTQNNVAGGGFYFGRARLDAAGAIIPVNMTIAVWNGLPGSGSLITSGNATLLGIGWLDAFWSPVNVIAGQTYYLELFTNDVQETLPGEPQVNSDFGTPGAPSYAGGAAYSWNRATGVYENSGNPASNFDLAFRTYYDNGPVTGVPEPGSLALLGLGLVGLGMSRRRKV